MTGKAFVALSVLAVIQSALSCGCGKGLGLGSLNNCGGVSSTGGNFPASSASPARPNGIAVQSDNQYEGKLCLGGNLPFLGTVALEGLLPTKGSSQVSYGCGNGKVGIIREQGASTGISTPGKYQPGSLSCGCRRL